MARFTSGRRLKLRRRRGRPRAPRAAAPRLRPLPIPLPLPLPLPLLQLQRLAEVLDRHQHQAVLPGKGGALGEAHHLARRVFHELTQDAHRGAPGEAREVDGGLGVSVVGARRGSEESRRGRCDSSRRGQEEEKP